MTTRKFRELGAQQAQSHALLPALAMEAAAQAAAGKLEPEDAVAVYAEYFQASSRLQKIDPYDNSIKANVSKLRQIIKAASPALLAKVTKTHERLARTSEAKPLYQAMVAVCRKYNHDGKMPSQADIARLTRR